MKIQVIYNMNIKDFKKIDIIDNATESDVSYTNEILKELEANELMIQDREYCSVKVFKVGKDYLDCLIFGKLIVITLMNCFYSNLLVITSYAICKQLSYMRFIKNIREELGTILNFITNYQNYNLFFNSINRVIKSSPMEVRNRTTTEQSFSLFDLPQEVLGGCKIFCVKNRFNLEITEITNKNKLYINVRLYL